MAFEIENNILKKYIEEYGVTEVIIPDGVKHIGYNSFFGCTCLKSITIPDSVTSIGSSAFYGCTHLTSITIPDNVTSIGNTTFAWCVKLTSITIPDSVTSIGYSAFSDCRNLTYITFPDSITSIGDRAFYGCRSLKSLIIPDHVKIIGNSSFYGCISLKSITIPDSIESIGSCAFFDCKSLKSVKIPDSIISISRCAFSGGIEIIICKSNVEITFILKGDWNVKKPEQALNNFIFADINNRRQYFGNLKSYYKVPLALFMIFAYPQETYYLDYLKNNTKETGRHLIDEGNIDLFYIFLEYGFVTKDNIDSLISYAVEHTQNGGNAEFQLILSKYKSDNFSPNSADTFDKFML